jgi:hypothetical protein
MLIIFVKCLRLSEITHSQEVASFLLQMAVLVLPPRGGTFLEQFGTPALLWRMLSSVGYTEAPRYTWTQSEALGDIPWYEVMLVVPLHPTNPLWHGWHAESDGHSLWEATQVTTLDMIMEIA